MKDVTGEDCCKIIQTYEPVLENRSVGILGIDGILHYCNNNNTTIMNFTISYRIVDLTINSHHECWE